MLGPMVMKFVVISEHRTIMELGRIKRNLKKSHLVFQSFMISLKKKESSQTAMLKSMK